MDIDLATFDGITKSAGFALPVVCLAGFYITKILLKMLKDAHEERRQAFALHASLLDKYNTAISNISDVIKTTQTAVEKNSLLMENRKCGYIEKNQN